MTKYDPGAQCRFIDIAPTPVRKPRIIEKQFKKSDFISLNLENKKTFQLRWALRDDAFKSLDLLSELVESVDGKGIISKSAIPFKVNGSGPDANPNFEDRIVSFSMLTQSIALHLISRAGAETTYRYPSSDEAWLILNRRDTLARYIVGHCIEITAREGVAGSTDVILNEFANFLPIMRR